MKLDKRYVTEIDLRRTTTGDPEGEPVDEHDAAEREELERGLDALRGEVELPIPAASAVKIGGERAYRLHRRGRRGRDADCARCASTRSSSLAYEDGIATSTSSSARAPTSASLADALGGHCLSLRRTEVGPFSGRGGRRSPGRARSRTRCHAAAQRAGDEDRARTVAARAPAARGRDRHLRRRAPRPPVGAARGDRLRARAHGDHVRPASTHRAREPRRADHDARAAARAARRGGGRDTLVAPFTPEFMRLAPEEFVATYLPAIGAEAVAAGEDFRFGASGPGTWRPSRGSA